MGGRTTDTIFALVQEYDPVANTWTRRTNSDVESFHGTGGTLTKEIQSVQPAAYYRPQRTMR